MILLVDAGNTRIKWAMIADDRDHLPAALSAAWLRSGSVARSDWAQLKEVWDEAASGLAKIVEVVDIVRVVISNVAGVALREQLAGMFAQWHFKAEAALQVDWLASQAALGGVENGYRQPTQLGCDRFASAIGAHALYPGQALIVATCGTATTIDAISPEGRFLGGMILPGLGLMATSLALNTAQLPQVADLGHVAAGFADNTGQAIVAGCIAAQTGAIERAVALHRSEYSAVRCLLAGGAGLYLTAHLAEPHERFDNLVLIGLHVLAIQSHHLC
jgi:type III pantothenate kinase